MGSLRALAVLLLAAPCAAIAAPAGAAATEKTLEGWRPYTPSWHPASVAVGERAVTLAVRQSSCGSRNLRVSIAPKRGAIEVSVSAEAAIYSGPGVMSCPGPHAQPVTVRLARRLDGRPLRGAGEATDTRIEESEMIGGRFVTGATTPRLIGFCLRDARLATEEVSLPVEVIGQAFGTGRSRVVRQSPRSGTFVPSGSAVNVRLG
jgi:hypothetical protein